jgi:hypothetical protein
MFSLFQCCTQKIAGEPQGSHSRIDICPKHTVVYIHTYIHTYKSIEAIGMQVKGYKSKDAHTSCYFCAILQIGYGT